MQGKGKKEVQKLLPFLTQIADPHQRVLMLLGYPEVSVSPAATDPSHKALWEWCVTRHAGKNCKDQEPPQARMCPIKTVPGLLCSSPCLCPDIFRVLCIWCLLNKKLKYNGKYELFCWSRWLCPRNHFNCIKYSWDIHILRSIDYKPLKW